MEYVICNGLRLCLDIIKRCLNVVDLAIFFDRIYHIREKWLFCGHFLLLGKTGMKLYSNVKLLRFEICHLKNIKPSFLRHLNRSTVLLRGDVVAEERLMRKDYVVILCDHCIHFQSSHAQFESPNHCRNGIFGHKPPAAAVTLFIKYW